MHYKNISIKHLLTIALIVASVVPVSIFTNIAFVESKNILESEFRLDIEVKSQTIIAEIDRIMFERSRNINSWSKLEVMHELRLGDVDKRLSRFLNDLKRSYQGVYVEIYAVNLAQQIVASSNSGQIGKQFEPTSLKNQLNQKQYIFSDKVIDPVTGELSGNLYAIFDWNQIIDLMDKSTGNKRSAALWTKQDELLASTSHWELYQKTEAITATSFSKGYQGANPLDWKVSVSQPKSTAFTPIRELGSIFLWFLLLLVLVASVSAVSLANHIARPIRKLSEFTKQFNLSTTTKAAPKAGPKELQALALAFDNMISDLKKSQENLTKAAKLATVGEMASAMSHEVRTPLGILKSSAQILMREKGLSEEAKEVCGFILSETERMNKLIDTLLDAGRSRPQEIVYQDFVALAKKTVSMLDTQSKNVNIQITGDKKLLIPFDAEQMTQVLLNLLINAIQATKKDTRIEINIYQHKKIAIIEIGDNGPGIPASILDKIFDPFFTQRKGGIGLGLAVVKKIIDAHQGKIEAGISELGGALFKIQLPLINKQNE